MIVDMWMLSTVGIVEARTEDHLLVMQPAPKAAPRAGRDS
jgi:hypothetical protein